MRSIDCVLHVLRELTNSKTDKEMCEILEIPYGTLDRWKANDEIPAKRLMEFSEKLGVSMDMLLNGSIKAADKIQPLSNTLLSTSSSKNTFSIKKITAYTASAGGGNEINDIEVYDTDEVLQIDKAFFKTPPSKKARFIKVDGYSMIPMLLPDSWVLFEEENEFKGDGLYVINYSGQLMVKLLQLTPQDVLKVISINKSYESYKIKLNESNEFFHIVGKVIKSIV